MTIALRKIASRQARTHGRALGERNAKQTLVTGAMCAARRLAGEFVVGARQSPKDVIDK